VAVLVVSTGLMLSASGLLPERAADVAQVYGVYTAAFLLLLTGVAALPKMNHRDTEAQRRQQEREKTGGESYSDTRPAVGSDRSFTLFCLFSCLLSSLCLCVSVVQLPLLLRGQAFAEPAGAAAAEADAVVQPAGSALPEFDGVGHDPVAAPERRPRHFVAGEAGADLGHRPFERCPVGDRLRLAAGPGGPPGPDGPRGPPHP